MRVLLPLVLSLSCQTPVEPEPSRFPSVDPTTRAEMLAPPTGRVDVVIDTDLTNEIDDEFALVWALLSPESLDIQAVYAAPHAIWPALLETGVSELDARIFTAQLAELGLEPEDLPTTDPADGMRAAHAEAEEILGMMGADAPAFRGADEYLPDARTPVDSDAVQDLVERARQDRDGPLYVVVLGAPTNVASALLTAPDIVDDIVVVWTSAYPTFWPGPNASFNLAQDLHASRLLFDSGVPLVYVPGFYVAEELRVTLPEMTEYVADRGEAGAYLYDLYDGHPIIGDHYARSKVLWDLAPLAWLIEPDWLVTRTVPTPLLDDQRIWRPRAEAPDLREATDLWRDAVFRDLYDKLALEDGPL